MVRPWTPPSTSVKSPDLLGPEDGPEDVRSCQVYLSRQKTASWSTLNLAVSALRFLYRVTLGREWALGHIPLLSM